MSEWKTEIKITSEYGNVWTKEYKAGETSDWYAETPHSRLIFTGFTTMEKAKNFLKEVSETEEAVGNALRIVQDDMLRIAKSFDDKVVKVVWYGKIINQ